MQDDNEIWEFIQHSYSSHTQYEAYKEDIKTLACRLHKEILLKIEIEGENKSDVENLTEIYAQHEEINKAITKIFEPISGSNAYIEIILAAEEELKKSQIKSPFNINPINSTKNKIENYRLLFRDNTTLADFFNKNSNARIMMINVMLNLEYVTLSHVSSFSTQDLTTPQKIRLDASKALAKKLKRGYDNHEKIFNSYEKNSPSVIENLQIPEMLFGFYTEAKINNMTVAETDLDDLYRYNNRLTDAKKDMQNKAIDSYNNHYCQHANGLIKTLTNLEETLNSPHKTLEAPENPEILKQKNDILTNLEKSKEDLEKELTAINKLLVEYFKSPDFYLEDQICHIENFASRCKEANKVIEEAEEFSQKLNEKIYQELISAYRHDEEIFKAFENKDNKDLHIKWGFFNSKPDYTIPYNMKPNFFYNDLNQIIPRFKDFISNKNTILSTYTQHYYTLASNLSQEIASLKKTLDTQNTEEAKSILKKFDDDAFDGDADKLNNLLEIHNKLLSEKNSPEKKIKHIQDFGSVYNNASIALKAAKEAENQSKTTQALRENYNNLILIYKNYKTIFNTLSDSFAQNKSLQKPVVIHDKSLLISQHCEDKDLNKNIQKLGEILRKNRIYILSSYDKYLFSAWELINKLEDVRTTLKTQTKTLPETLPVLPETLTVLTELDTVIKKLKSIIKSDLLEKFTQDQRIKHIQDLGLTYQNATTAFENAKTLSQKLTDEKKLARNAEKQKQKQEAEQSEITQELRQKYNNLFLNYNSSKAIFTTFDKNNLLKKPEISEVASDSITPHPKDNDLTEGIKKLSAIIPDYTKNIAEYNLHYSKSASELINNIKCLQETLNSQNKASENNKEIQSILNNLNNFDKTLQELLNAHNAVPDTQPLDFSSQDKILHIKALGSAYKNAMTAFKNAETLSQKLAALKEIKAKNQNSYKELNELISRLSTVNASAANEIRKKSLNSTDALKKNKDQLENQVIFQTSVTSLIQETKNMLKAHEEKIKADAQQKQDLLAKIERLEKKSDFSSLLSSQLESQPMEESQANFDNNNQTISKNSEASTIGIEKLTQINTDLNQAFKNSGNAVKPTNVTSLKTDLPTQTNKSEEKDKTENLLQITKKQVESNPIPESQPLEKKPHSLSSVLPTPFEDHQYNAVRIKESAEKSTPTQLTDVNQEFEAFKNSAQDEVTAFNIEFSMEEEYDEKKADAKQKQDLLAKIERLEKKSDFSSLLSSPLASQPTEKSQADFDDNNQTISKNSEASTIGIEKLTQINTDLNQAFKNSGNAVNPTNVTALKTDLPTQTNKSEEKDKTENLLQITKKQVESNPIPESQPLEKKPHSLSSVLPTPFENHQYNAVRIKESAEKSTPTQPTDVNQEFEAFKNSAQVEVTAFNIEFLMEEEEASTIGIEKLTQINTDLNQAFKNSGNAVKPTNVTALKTDLPTQTNKSEEKDKTENLPQETKKQAVEPIKKDNPQIESLSHSSAQAPTSAEKSLNDSIVMHTAQNSVAQTQNLVEQKKLLVEQEKERERQHQETQKNYIRQIKCDVESFSSALSKLEENKRLLPKNFYDDEEVKTIFDEFDISLTKQPLFSRILENRNFAPSLSSYENDSLVKTLAKNKPKLIPEEEVKQKIAKFDIAIKTKLIKLITEKEEELKLFQVVQDKIKANYPSFSMSELDDKPVEPSIADYIKKLETLSQKINTSEEALKKYAQNTQISDSKPNSESEATSKNDKLLDSVFNPKPRIAKLSRIPIIKNIIAMFYPSFVPWNERTLEEKKQFMQDIEKNYKPLNASVSQESSSLSSIVQQKVRKEQPSSPKKNRQTSQKNSDEAISRSQKTTPSKKRISKAEKKITNLQKKVPKDGEIFKQLEKIKQNITNEKHKKQREELYEQAKKLVTYPKPTAVSSIAPAKTLEKARQRPVSHTLGYTPSLTSTPPAATPARALPITPSTSEYQKILEELTKLEKDYIEFRDNELKTCQESLINETAGLSSDEVSKIKTNLSAELNKIQLLHKAILEKQTYLDKYLPLKDCNVNFSSAVEKISVEFNSISRKDSHFHSVYIAPEKTSLTDITNSFKNKLKQQKIIAESHKHGKALTPGYQG